MKEKGTLTTGKKAVLGVVAVVIVIVIGMMIYNSPTNRLNRQLDLGYRYLEEENYEQARIAFEEAISIDEKCLEAYAGIAQAYQNTGDKEALLSLCQQAIEAVKAMDAASYEANTDYINMIYAAVDEALTERLESLLELKDYEGIKALLDQYREYATDTFIEEWEKRVVELEEKEAVKVSYMSKLYDYLAADDMWSVLNDEFYRETAEFMNTWKEEDCVYIPEDPAGKQGKGVGLYTYGEPLTDGSRLFYFYYGDYNNGMRDGVGESYSYGGEGCSALFSGYWKEDSPNGEGRIINYGIDANIIEEGMLKDGLWEGEITVYCYDFDRSDYLYETTFMASGGIPVEDKSEEYAGLYGEPNFNGPGEVLVGGLSSYGYGHEEPWYDKVENGYIYAYYYDKANNLFQQYVGVKGQRMGAIGYADDLEQVFRERMEWEFFQKMRGND